MRNHLTTNLDLVVRIYAQDFFILQMFPFHATITYWNEAESQYGLEL
jgi:hypothetical protein